jgi:hypothetical protein
MPDGGMGESPGAGPRAARNPGFSAPNAINGPGNATPARVIALTPSLHSPHGLRLAE